VLKQGFSTTSTEAATVVGESGDRLPYSTRLSGNLSIEDEFPIADRWSGFFGALLTYMGDRKGDFQYTGVSVPRLDLPAYTKLDLRAGVKYESWKVNLSVNNVADRRGATGGFSFAFDTPPQEAFIYIQPRTLALSVSKQF